MGHLVNPISIRLGIVKTWNSTWVTNKGVSYTYLLSKDIELQKSLDIFFNKSNTTDVWAIIFDKAFVIRTSRGIFVFIILYSWKFFNMVDNIFDAVFCGKEFIFSAFKKNDFNSIKKNVNLTGKKKYFSIFKKSIEVYSELLKFSLESLKNSTFKFLRIDFFNLILYKLFKDFLILKTRYLTFFKSLQDIILTRFLLLKLIEKWKTFRSFKKIKLNFFLNLLVLNLFSFSNRLQNEFKIFFFKNLKKNIIFNCFNILHLKKITKRKKKFLLIKKKISRIFEIRNIILNKNYLKSVLSVFNTKLKSFAYLLKQNHLWLIFVLIKIFLRKNMSSYYGKRLWYIKSYVDYFFNYKNKQEININTFFLFPSYVLLTAKMIAYVIRIRLTQKYSLGEILNKFVSFLNKEPELIGFRITCHGRFTRRQRASHRLVKSSLKNKDKLLLNTFSGFVDYAYIEQPLKYGMCGIRIWLVKDPQIETTHYHSILKRFFIKKRYKKGLFDLLKLNKCLRFLDIYKTNIKKDFFCNVKISNYVVINKKRRTLFRYLKLFHFMYYLKFKRTFGFEKNNNKPKIFSNASLKVLKKNIFLLY